LLERLRRLRLCLRWCIIGGAPLSVTLAEQFVSNANTTLVFPSDPDLKQLSGKRIPLTFGPPHPKSRGGHPILVDPEADVVTLEAFRRLRVKLGARIETDDLARVREALGVRDDEPGLVLVTARSVTELP
jgi:hypothetical protein